MLFRGDGLRDKVFYNENLANRAVAFINSLKHTKGEWYGKHFELLEWQEKIVRDIFGTVKENGYRPELAPGDTFFDKNKSFSSIFFIYHV